MTRILIIEDEKDAASRLEKLLRQIEPDIEIMACLDSVEASVKWFETHSAPDLLLLDIQLGDGQSFDIFKKVQVDCFVIFTTAYDEYAIRAFELNSIDYLLKPVDPGKLQNSFAKFQRLKKSASPFDINKLLAEIAGKKESFKKRFVVNVCNKLKSIEIKDVAFFYAMEKNTFLCIYSGMHYPLDYSLDHLEEILDPDQYFRINRQTIVHFGAITRMSLMPKSRIKLYTTPEGPTELMVSTNRTAGFRKWLDK